MPPTPDERTRAGKAVRERIAARGLTVTGVARSAGIDPKTLTAFMDGRSWPREATRHRIERAISWPAGELMNQSRGLRPSLAAYTTLELATEIIARLREGEARETGV